MCIYIYIIYIHILYMIQMYINWCVNWCFLLSVFKSINHPCPLDLIGGHRADEALAIPHQNSSSPGQLDLWPRKFQFEQRLFRLLIHQSRKSIQVEPVLVRRMWSFYFFCWFHRILGYLCWPKAHVNPINFIPFLGIAWKDHLPSILCAKVATKRLELPGSAATAMTRWRRNQWHLLSSSTKLNIKIGPRSRSGMSM